MGANKLATEPNDKMGALRKERDRFVALAFCASDLLFEVDDSGDIAFAAGATKALVGVSPDRLPGKRFLDLFQGDDRPLIGELVRELAHGRRMEALNVRLAGPNGPTPPLLLTGYNLPDLPGSHFFAMRVRSDHDLLDDPSLPVDKDTGLLQQEGFAKVASEQIKIARDNGEELKLTMVRMPGFDAFKDRLDGETGRKLMKTIGACLRVEAGKSSSVGRFDSQNYGMVHRPEVNVGAMRQRLESYMQAADPDGVGLPVKTGTVSADMSPGNEKETVNAILYTIHQFCEDDSDEPEVSDLNANLEKLVRSASQKLTDFRAIVQTENFDVAFQPIVHLASRQIEHFEALARFGGGSDRSPYELITFAENTGLICDFDFAMCCKILEWLLTWDKPVPHPHVAVNLSGRSVGNSAFLEQLHKLLAKHPGVRAHLMFEITESARIKDLAKANTFIQELRKRGHKVCLDDFGAGATAFRYLHALDIDVVKIDGHYSQGVVKGRKHRAFLKSISGLCRELGVSTISEMIEDLETATALEECGVEFGQGYFFGKPSLDIMTFLGDPADGPAPSRRGGGQGR